jgi:serine protease DegS
MAISTLRRNAIFLAGSVLAGLALAFLVGRLWPEITRNHVLPATTASAPATDSALEITPVAPTVRDSAALAPAQAVPEGATDLLAQAPTGSFASAVRASSPAVVSVYTQRTVDQGYELVPVPGGMQAIKREGIEPGLGSGVIIDAQGHIVTNHHVIEGYDPARIKVRLADGRITAARVVGRDPATDLAVLKIDLQKLPVMKLGRSDRVAVGDVVLAIGSPFELLQTVTHGIVSATGRSGLGVTLFEDFIQTDAAINRGNSGGALVNTRGELIGINTAVLGKNQGAEGIGVAIPVDLVRGVLSDILEHGQVMRGWIGIAVDNVSEAVARQNRLPNAGLLVLGLARNSPALKPGGLALYDKIETIDGQAARTPQDALARIASHKPQTAVRITGMRGNQPFSATVTVIEPPPLAE